MKSNKSPADFPRRILLGASGLSPQVITETLYALAVSPPAGEAPFIPTEIHLVTTARGAEQARLNLLSEQPGWFHRLRSDYGLPPIAFGSASIHTMTDTNGQPLEDIRTPADNELAANFITELMRELTTDDEATLHVSIAGGRKTMGFYVGYALSLFARPQDRLSHVLVDAQYENLPGFFYPTPYEHILHTRDLKTAVDAAKAEVQLARIPFVSLRQGVERVVKHRITFREAVSAAELAMSPPRLILHSKTKKLTAGGVEIDLTPTEFSIMAVFAWRAINGLGGMRAPLKDCCDEEWTDEFHQLLEAALGMDLDTAVEEKLEKRDLDQGFFTQHRSRIKGHLQTALGPAAEAYLVKKRGTAKGLYSIGLTPAQIEFE